MPQYNLIVSSKGSADLLTNLLESRAIGFSFKLVESYLGQSQGSNAGILVAVGDIISFSGNYCWSHDKNFPQKVSDCFREEFKVDSWSVFCIDAVKIKTYYHAFRRQINRWFSYITEMNRT